MQCDGIAAVVQLQPRPPEHWFYREWIRKTKEKHALYLHFTMANNPSLSKRVRQRYERMYSGAFYDRFVLGKWTAADGWCIPCLHRNAMWCRRLRPVTATGSPVIMAQ